MSMLKVLGLNGCGLEVPDLDVAQRFYTTFGLAADRKADVLRLRSPGRPNDEIVVASGPKKRLNHVSFFIAPGSEALFAGQLRGFGFRVEESPPQGGIRDGLWFQDPWGTWINLSPQRPAPVQLQPTPTYNFGGSSGRVDTHLWQELKKDNAPLRLGYILMFTSEMDLAERFFCEVLGFRTSDRVTGKIAFLAAGEGLTDHHCFGLVNSTHRGFQHASFHVASVDDIGFGAWRLGEAGYTEGLGIGRHALASNLFHYTRDPWGSWVEYYTDMDKITDKWVTRDWNTLPYIWGPKWSPEYWGKQMNGNFEPR